MTRLDSYLAEYYPEYSRSSWQKYIKQGSVKVNNEVITSSKYDLGEDDHVTYDIPEVEHEQITIPIIYEDENVLVIDKPAGILSHAKGAINEEPTVATWLLHHISEFARSDLASKESDSENNRLGIVHRLDRDTSGVMILAKNENAAKMLQKQFADRKVKKSYLAIVKGSLKHPEANIDLPIERNPKLPSQFRVGAGGKAATTHYKMIDQTKKFSLVELKPQTGRTHQLRVHTSYLNAPILGDRIYGPKADRLYLHAATLEITIPKSQRRVFKAKLPETFSIIMKSDE